MPAKILIVDDEPGFERLIRQRFRKKLRSNEYEFIFASNGQEALDILADVTDLDVILTDINMPKMDGLTLLAKLSNFESSTKAVIVSAYGDMVNIRTAMNRGAYDFVTKPINFEDLEITLNKALKEIEMLRLAEQAKQELDHLQQELMVAQEVQQSILPQNFDILPKGSPYRFYASMTPAKEVGGDFYDFFLIDETHLGVVVGDVSGKGMPAALFMAVSRTLLKAIGHKVNVVSDCLVQANDLLSQNNPSSMFVTVFYAVLNLQTGTLDYASGGHNPPYLLHADGRLETLDNSQNVALGIMENLEYKSRQTLLAPRTSLVIFTDGVTEAMNTEKQFFSEEKLKALLADCGTKDPQEIVEETVNAVNEFSAGIPQSDDITLMVVKRED